MKKFQVFNMVISQAAEKFIANFLKLFKISINFTLSWNIYTATWRPTFKSVRISFWLHQYSQSLHTHKYTYTRLTALSHYTKRTNTRPENHLHFAYLCIRNFKVHMQEQRQLYNPVWKQCHFTYINDTYICQQNIQMLQWNICKTKKTLQICTGSLPMRSNCKWKLLAKLNLPQANKFQETSR